MPSIMVSGWVKDRLLDIKEREGHKSIDSVIRSLIPQNIVEDARETNEKERRDIWNRR